MKKYVHPIMRNLVSGVKALGEKEGRGTLKSSLGTPKSTVNLAKNVGRTAVKVASAVHPVKVARRVRRGVKKVQSEVERRTRFR